MFISQAVSDALGSGVISASRYYYVQVYIHVFWAFII